MKHMELDYKVWYTRNEYEFKEIYGEELHNSFLYINSGR